MNIQKQFLGRPFILSAVLLGLFAFFIYGLGSAKGPLVFSFILAYLCLPVVVRLEKWGVKRIYSVFGLFFLLALLVLVVSVMVLPGLVQDLGDLIKSFPEMLRRALEKVEGFLLARGIDAKISRTGITSSLQEKVQLHSGTVINYLFASVAGAFSSLTGFVLSILNLILFPVFFFYMVSDFEKVSSLLYEIIPEGARPVFNKYFELSGRVFSAFFRGQISVVIILGVLYAIGLKIIGLKYGVVIGLVSGAISFIPYGGLMIGLASAIVVYLAHNGGLGELVGILVTFSVVQTLESFVVTPRLVGGNVGLNPFESILALIVWGNVLGFSGLLLGIPLSAIIRAGIIDLFTSSSLKAKSRKDLKV
jgi:predicted PurR-regulated permease PerM